MKHRIKRKILAAAAVLLCAATVFSTAGCRSGEPSYAEREQLIEELYGAVELETNEQTGGNATTSNFVMAYYKDDTMNPYLCTSTLNATVTELIYDQLITVNSEFEAEMVIAQKVEYGGARVINVTLRDGIVFSDGTPLTGADVVYSFEAARREATGDKPGSRYANTLTNFQSCINTADNKVTFRLNEADPRAYMLLDFPIIKAESDADNKTPIGSGRYVYISDVLTGTYLLRNEKWYNTNISDVRRISLTSMPTVESIVKSVEIGTISYYYTDLRFSDKYYPNRINANYAFVDINNLVYLGVNTTEPTLGQTSVRKAISCALDREDVIAAGFAGRAYASTGPLTTSWPVAAAAQSGSTVALKTEAEGALVEARFVNTDIEKSVKYNDRGEYLDYELIANAENEHHMLAAQQIASQLSKYGISVTVVPVEFSVLRQRIAAGDYDLYLAEYSLLNNMDFSDLFTPNKGLYYGLTPQQTIDAWNDYLGGVSGIENVIQRFEAELPFIPVCYRLGIACYSRSMNTKPDVTESDPFWGMESWEVALAE